MNDNFEITTDGVIKPTEKEESTAPSPLKAVTKPKPKSRKAKVSLRDDMYLALHGLYSSDDVNVKRGAMCFIEGEERIAKLLAVNAIRKIQDIEIVKLESISRYHNIMIRPGYISAGDFLSQSDSEIMLSAQIPRNLVMHIRKLIEAELSQIED